MKYICVILTTLLAAGCAVMPVPKMADPQTSAIGIQIKILAPIGIFSNKPDRIYFVKLDNEDDITQNQVIPSNFTKDGRIYFLNAGPGKYAAVAAFRSQSVGKSNFITYFSKELIEATKVDVGRGEVAFMGSYVVQSGNRKYPEPIQNHYSELLAHGSSKRIFGQLWRNYHYLGTINEAKRDSDVRTEFIKRARDDLAEGGWGSIIK